MYEALHGSYIPINVDEDTLQAGTQPLEVLVGDAGQVVGGTGVGVGKRGHFDGVSP